MRNVVFISMTLLGLAIPVSADQSAVKPNSTAPFGAQRPPQSNPYAKLFEARDLLKQAERQHAAQEALKNATQDAMRKKMKIVCGTTIIEADPLFDAKMKVTPPKDPNVRYTIRGLEPPICNPAKQ